MSSVPVFSASGIGKSYGGHSVLSNVSFEVSAGERAALLGENGAGKSTLAKIIAGATRADRGTLKLDGHVVDWGSPRDALSHGVVFIPQELIYVPELTVAENLTLGALPTRMGFTSPRRIAQKAADITGAAGFELPLTATMSSLTLAQRQLVEIAKATSRQAKLVIFDEPTAALEAQDSNHLHGIVARMATEGTAVIYISHRLEEVFRTCDTVHVLRNGVLVRSSPTATTTPSQAIADMVGHASDDTPPATRASASTPIAQTVLSVADLNRAGAGGLDRVGLEVRKGEIVGVFGLRGSGADTLAEALGGLASTAVGTIRVGRHTVNSVRTPRQSWRIGIGYVPADRKTGGLVLLDSIARSFALPVLQMISKYGFVIPRAQTALATRLFDLVRVRARSINQPVGELSGGNQQKVLLGSRLAASTPVLVLHEPTRGVDVGARAEIHQILRELAASGTAQLVVSSDIEETVSLCQRVLVMRNGKIVHEITEPVASDQAIALKFAGGVA